VRSRKLTGTANPLHKFLPSLVPATTSLVHSELIRAHRSNVTWYLTHRLADASATQKEMQEERVKRQLDRARSLGGSSGLGETSMNSSATSFGSSSFQFVPPPVTSASDTVLGLEDDDGSEADVELTEVQIQQFEAENAAILRQQEDLLTSVKQAESRLLDISALQTELVVQLVRQTEMVDTLYDEAMASQTEVEKGNEQLRKARERARSSRKWILMFILFAIFCLLFLHWYD
jgi:syntaxin 18